MSSQLGTGRARKSANYNHAFSEPEQLLEAYFNSATVGLSICDEHLRYQAINQALAAMNGYPAEEHLGKTVRDIMGPAAQEVETSMHRVFETGEPILNLQLALKLPTRRDIGHWIENYFPVKDAHGRVKQIGVVVIEITAQKKLEESLHHLTGKLLRAKDEEQQRLARALHDSINQYHAAIKMNLRMMKRSNLTPAKREKLLLQSLDLLDHCISETRTIAHLLHPPSLDKMGFASAARWYVEGFAQRSGIDARLRVKGRGGRLPPEIEIALFRILQEALTNVHRHAKTDAVEIEVSRQAGQIALQVKDYGRGIPAEKLKRLRETADHGMGVASMRERIHELGGQMRIQSSRQGTRVEVSVPIPKKESTEK